MRILFAFPLIVLFLITDASGKKKKWLKHPRIVVLRKEHGLIKEDESKEAPKKLHHHSTQHQGHSTQHQGHSTQHHARKSRNKQMFKTDSLPYSSPYARPYDWSMYSDGPYGWGPGRKRRQANSFHKFKRSLYPQNYASQQYTTQQQQPMYQPATQTAYFRSPMTTQPYNYQAPQSRNTLGQANSNYAPQPPTQTLQREAPKVQQPQERTWVDKMGVKWTTRKVNDYKWGEREPGVMMDEYAGGPFGFDDVKRNEILRENPQPQWQRRSSIARPSSNIRPRSWIDDKGVRWTNRHVNDYKWGEREPGVTMDEYNGGPFGWDDVKRSRIFAPSSKATPRNMYMYMDKP